MILTQIALKVEILMYIVVYIGLPAHICVYIDFVSIVVIATDDHAASTIHRSAAKNSLVTSSRWQTFICK